MTILIGFNTSNLKAQTTYYVCDCATGADPNCVQGNDANNGTNPATPWQSITKVQSVVNMLQSGDQILFAKGGAWTNSSMSIYNFNSISSNPIVFDSYTPSWGGQAKPILTESRSGYNVFEFSNPGNGVHDEGYLIRNLELRGNGTGMQGFFLYNDVDYVTVENMDIDGFQIAVYLGEGNTPDPGADQENQFFTLKNSNLINNASQGFLGGGDNLLIENCHFENNGFLGSVFYHNIYVSLGDNVVIRANELFKCAIVNGQSSSTSLVVHGLHDSLLIENNYVHEDSGTASNIAWGIAVDPAYATAEGFNNVTIRGNIVENMNNVAIGVASCRNTIIENNIIISESGSGITGIAAPDRQRGTEDMPMDSVTIRNNTLFFRNTTGANAIVLGDEGGGHILVSNAVSLDNGIAFTLNLPASSYTAVDYNFVETSTSNAFWGNNTSLSTWTSTTGFDANSQNGNPNYTSTVAPYNFYPLSNSPLIDNGHLTLSSAFDYNNINRISPDIGAYEYSNPLGIQGIEYSDVPILYYPNPVSDKLFISLKNKGDTYISVVDIHGRTILSRQLFNTELVQINVTDLTPGIYLIKIDIKNRNTQTFKIIKK